MISEKKMQSEEALQKFHDLVDDVHICMFTTIDNNGEVMSRPMWTVKIDEEGNVWFFTNEFSEKVQEVSKDSVVNLIYAHPGKNIYVNVKGTCAIIIDKSKMKDLWKPAMKEWFPEGLDDAKLCLLKVNTENAHYWNTSSGKVATILKSIKAIAKGDSLKEEETGKLDLNNGVA